jgi:signal transduction histidine kinase
VDGAGRLLKETASARQQLQFVERECQRWQRQAIQLAQQQQELLQQHKLRSLAAFAAGAGHELGSPLAVISGYAEQLLRQEKQLERIQALERILAQTRRIHALVLDLMFFARPPEPKKRRLRLDRLLRQVVGRFVCEAEQKQITLSCTCPDQAISMVADGSLLQTAIECLLRNALEAAPQGGRVSCSVEPLDSDQVQVIVEDNGPGPDPAWQEHLFDPFFSGRQAGRGRGLGLSKVVANCRTPRRPHHLASHSPPHHPVCSAIAPFLIGPAASSPWRKTVLLGAALEPSQAKSGSGKCRQVSFSAALEPSQAKIASARLPRGG